VARPYAAVTCHVGVNGGLYVFEPPAGGHRYTSRAAPAEPEVVKDLAAVAQHEREIINARTSAALKRRPSREFASRSGPQERLPPPVIPTQADTMTEEFERVSSLRGLRDAHRANLAAHRSRHGFEN
jgi:hypothetical protein